MTTAGRVKTTIPSGKYSTVSISTLDKFFEEAMGHLQINAVKIDAEGHEHNILSGAKKFIFNKHPDIFIIEILESSGEKFGNNVKDLMLSMGYTFVYILDNRNWIFYYNGINNKSV